MTKRQKILVLRFSSIGDIVLTTPVVRCLKEQLTNVEVHFATKKSFGGMMVNNPFVDKVHLLDGNEQTLINQLKTEKFDVIIDLHHSLRTLKIKFALGVKSYSFNKLNVRKALFVKFKLPLMPDVHIVDRYMETVSHLGVVNDNKGLDYFIPEKDKTNLSDLIPSSFVGHYICFAIGGQHQTKRLPIHKMVELCQKIAQPIVLLGGPADEEDAGQLIELLPEGKEIVSLAGKCNLNQSAWLVQNALKLITHDTGMMHIGAALKANIISVWGNTVPELGMYPYQTEHSILEVKGLGCRPCHKLGFEKCPKGHFKCMNNIVFDDKVV